MGPVWLLGAVWLCRWGRGLPGGWGGLEDGWGDLEGNWRGGLAGATRGRPASVAQYGLPPLRATECAPFVRMRGAADSRNLHNQTVSNAHPPPFSNSLGKPCVETATRRRVLLVDGGRGRTAPLPPGSRQPSQEATFSILQSLPEPPPMAPLMCSLCFLSYVCGAVIS